MKTICFFGIYDPEYSRNRVLMSGFRENNWEVIQCRISPKLKRGFSKYIALIRMRYQLVGKIDLVLVAFPGQTVALLARILFPHAKIIFDAFLSLYDSNVYDRKVYTAHSVGGIKDWVLDWHSCMSADYVLLDTQEHIRYFSRTFGIPEKKMIRVPIGADPKIFSPAMIPSPHAGFIVHFHGMFIPLQGIKYIIQAAEILKDKPITFSIVGSGQEFAEIQSLVNEKKLTNIVLHGKKPLEMLPEYIAQADVCLGIFGDTEKTLRVIPNKVYEYLAMGKAVITADTPAMREFFQNKKEILLCKTADDTDLANSILALQSDPQRRDQLAQAAGEFFRTEFLPGKIVFHLLEEILRTR